MCAQDSEGQGTQACCNPWGCKELNMNYQLITNNNNNIKGHVYFFMESPSVLNLQKRY